MSYVTSLASVSHYSNVDTYTGVDAANPHRLVLMLLDGALGKLALAKGSMARNEIKAKGEALGQTISIINGLRASLNLSDGGDIAANLDNIYEYIERQLLQANLKNEPALLDEGSDLLREIREAWDAIPYADRTHHQAV